MTYNCNLMNQVYSK